MPYSQILLQWKSYGIWWWQDHRHDCFLAGKEDRASCCDCGLSRGNCNKDVSIIGFFADQTTDATEAYLAAATNLNEFQVTISSASGIVVEYKIEGEAVLLLKIF